MEKMARIKDTEREQTRRVFLKLDDMIKNTLKQRKDVEVLFVSYNDILSDPEKSIQSIHDFLGSAEFDRTKMLEAVDKKLYRNRRVRRTS
jgi:hypothetical protein